MLYQLSYRGMLKPEGSARVEDLISFAKCHSAGLGPRQAQGQIREVFLGVNVKERVV
jgi:hypothetical protein